ncbi:class IIb bacteriocin, lactobin A/cerein 7B family [Flavobacterium sp. ZS1P70]|uniref:Class IIb bacteriocin, lactobin A/cerein 7B family n=1 Tax=Flavobacterium zhoui TaxID=3230414 RepID=A0ABW6I930_9FLAO
MNLDNLNLVELNAQEMQETEGGFIAFLLGLGLGILILKTIEYLLE